MPSWSGFELLRAIAFWRYFILGLFWFQLQRYNRKSKILILKLLLENLAL